MSVLPAPTPEPSAVEEAPDPGEWSMRVTDNGELFPFIEDENGNITGLGHQDLAEFAAAVNRYDDECNGAPFAEDEQWNDGHVGHRWVTLDPDGERLHPVTAETPGAFAVTAMWNVR